VVKLINDLFNKFKDMLPTLNSKEVVEIANLLLTNMDNNKIIITTTVILDVDDVLYLCDHKKNRVEIVTIDASYIYSNKSNNDLLEILNKNHNNFKFINTSSMVNINKIKMYDYFLKRLYFTSDKSKCVNTTVAAMEQIKKVLGKQLDISQDTSIVGEYSQIRKSHC
jgi:hypothetical protein